MSKRAIRNALFVARRKRDAGGGLTEPARLCNIKSKRRL